MTTLLNAPAPNVRARRRRAEARALRELAQARRCLGIFKEAEASRVSVCHGCHYLGCYRAGTPTGKIVAALERWAGATDARVGPEGLAHYDFFEWEPGEQLAVWGAGKVQAVVTKRPDGTTSTTLFPE